MSTLVFVLFMAGMFGIGVWLGWHMAHINTRIDADLAEYLSTGSLPALSFDRSTLSVSSSAIRRGVRLLRGRCPRCGHPWHYHMGKPHGCDYTMVDGHYTLYICHCPRHWMD